MEDKTLLEELLERSPDERMHKRKMDKAYQLMTMGFCDEADALFDEILAEEPFNRDAMTGKKLIERQKAVENRLDNLAARARTSIPEPKPGRGSGGAERDRRKRARLRAETQAFALKESESRARCAVCRCFINSALLHLRIRIFPVARFGTADKTALFRTPLDVSYLLSAAEKPHGFLRTLDIEQSQLPYR